MPTALKLTMEPNGVAVVTFDVPGEPQNTLKPYFRDDFMAIMDTLEKDAAVKAVVLISGKDDSFIAGADVSVLKQITTRSDAEAASRAGQEALGRWEKLNVPTVAAIHGACLGGGLEVALACTDRVCSGDRKTVLGLPEVQLGLLPGAGGTQRLPKVVGIANALDLILTGRQLKPAKAKKLGLVSDVVRREILKNVAIQRALQLAKEPQRDEPQSRLSKIDFKKLTDPKEIQRLALEETPFGRALMFKKAREGVMKKTKGHYPAPLRALDAIEAGVSKGAEAGYRVEAQGFGELVVSDIAKRLIELFFATTAMKKESGVDGKTKGREVQRVAVLGGGLMGSGIAYVGAANGYEVRIKERNPEAAAGGLKAVRKLFDERAKKKSITSLERDEQFARMSATQEWLGFSRTDIFIEAVFEDLKIKHDMVQNAESVAPEAIFATNTSSLPIAKIAEGAKRPENVVGMHFFSPVNKMPLLEVIRAPKTSDEAVATAVAVGKKMGKTVIVVKDSTGFYTTRIVAPYTNEAAHCLAEGAPVELIDQALTGYGWPVGPMALMDEVGIDVGAKVAQIIVDAFGERMMPPKGFEALIKDGRSGRKNKKGFYLYDEKKKRPDPSIYAVIGVTPNPAKFDRQEIAERCTLMFVNEAMYCWGDGILRSPRDGDIGAIFGLGFPPFLGGPFRYVDTKGAANVVKQLETFAQKYGPRFKPAPALVDIAKNNKKFYE